MAIKKKTTSTKYVQARNLTFYFNDCKRSGKERREDAFLMVDDEELIELADTLRDQGEDKDIIAKLCLSLMIKGNINMSFGDEQSTDKHVEVEESAVATLLAQLKAAK